MKEYQEVRTTEHESGRGRRMASYKATQLVWLLLGLLDGVLVIRVVFKLIAVNPANAFATLLYNVTNLFLKPFASLVRPLESGSMVLELSTIIAMIVYLLVAWALDRILYVLFYRPRGPVTTKQTYIAEQVPERIPPERVPPVIRTTTTPTRIVTEHPTDPEEPVVVEHTEVRTREPR